MKATFGQKIGMTRVFNENGDSLGVTVIKVSPIIVLRAKTAEKDGYNAAVVGFGEIREKLLSKPAKGQFGKSGIKPTKYLREIRIDGKEIPEAGTEINVDIFKPGERINVTGKTRGKGFQGTVRRHGFGGGPKTHGQSDRYRAPGSIGQSSNPSRVFKGTRMAGHMGNRKITAKNLEVYAVEPEQSLLIVKGVVPGHKNSLLLLSKAGQ
jgi:large subunit ribosomal protein L3